MDWYSLFVGAGWSITAVIVIVYRVVREERGKYDVAPHVIAQGTIGFVLLFTTLFLFAAGLAQRCFWG